MARERSVSTQYGLGRLDEIAWNADEFDVDISIFISPLTETQKKGGAMRFGGKDIPINTPLRSEVNAIITYTSGDESKIFR